MSAEMTQALLMDRPFATYGELIREQALTRPEHPALIQDGRSVSFAQLDAMMDRVAAALERDGIEPTTAVAICANTSIAYAVAFLGALRAGVAVAPLAPSSTAQSLADMAANAQARLIFVDAATAELLEPMRATIQARFISLDDSGGEAFSTWLAAPGTSPTAVSIKPDWPFNIIYSSGTTGAPKGIVQSHGMRWVHAQRTQQQGYGLEAITMIATPLYSNTTLVSFFPTVVLGGTAVLMAKFDAAAYLALAERHRATHTMLVPVQYQRLMAHPEFDRYDLSSFRMKLCTSAPFAAALKADIVKRWPGGLVEYYGMTEGGGTCMLAAHEHPDKLSTVGTPAEGHDIRLIDEAGHEVSRDQIDAIGEIVGHSPAMMNGYYRQPEKTREAEWYAPDGKRFIRTGDVGRFDSDGFLTLMDRKKDMIISGGFNVYPSDLEALLVQHASVSEVAVVGVASDRWGETPVAFVVLRSAADSPQVGAGNAASTLRDWANERLGKTQRLAAVEIVDSLPRSAIGKVLKRELRDNFHSAAPL